jgi:uncharacterized protein (DUF849 family)
VTRVQACLNGSRPRGAHPALPLDGAALADAARTCAAAGATSVHLHPRDAAGAETLDGAVVDATVLAVRRACPGIGIGVTTGAWILPDASTRLLAVREWSAPDFASVNLSEDGAAAVMAALLERGIGVEAGAARGCRSRSAAPATATSAPSSSSTAARSTRAAGAPARPSAPSTAPRTSGSTSTCRSSAR